MSKLRVVGAAILSGTFGYCLVDATNEALAFRKCRQLAMDIVDGHDQVRDFVCSSNKEADISLGPWYNSSLKLTHSGRMAIATFRIDGPSASSEVWIRATRPEDGWPSTFLYNTVGPAKWHLLNLEATIKTEGGLAKRVSLLEGSRSPSGTDSEATATGCQECTTQPPIKTTTM